MASKLISSALNKPVAHGPVDYAIPGFHEIVDRRKAIEIVTLNFIHCLLKGLNKVPRLSTTKRNGALGAEDVDVMISPMGRLGEPHEACLERGIPIVVVRENKSVLHEYEDGDEWFIFVENYVEAAGLMMAMKAGIHPSSVRRPLGPTTVLSGKIDGLRANTKRTEDKKERRYETTVEIPERRTDRADPQRGVQAA